MVWAAFELPKPKKFVKQKINIALDGINDPGNLGTIIRVCDWFGIKHLICSQDTVDCFNPKVIQASMGSIARVYCHYVIDLGTTLSKLKKPIYGTSVDGASIYKTRLSKKASYVFGSESHGISLSVSDNLNGEFSIPQLRKGNSKAESLNVAIASAIFLGEIFRRS